MNKHIAIADDRLEEIVALRQRLEETRGQRDEQQHQEMIDKLTHFEAFEREHREKRAEMRHMAAAYNRAAPEEQALPLHEWLALYRDQRGQTA